MIGCWLLEVEICGRMVYVTDAVEPIEMTRGGRVAVFVPGLPALRLEDGGPAPGLSVSLAPPDGEPWRVAGGVGPEGGAARLWRWWPGDETDLDRLVPRMVGAVVAAELSRSRRWGSFAISARTNGERRAMHPSSGARVDDATWPVTAFWQIQEGSRGAIYPRVFGAPGTAGVVPVPVVNCPVLEMSDLAPQIGSYLCVADRPVGAAAVYVEHAESGRRQTCAVVTVTDLLGREVSAVALHQHWTVVRQALKESSWIVGWDAEAAGFGAADIRSAPDVIEWVLGNWLDGEPVDWGSIASLRSALASFQIDAAITEPVDPIEWLQRVVMPIIPATLVSGPNGWALVDARAPRLPDARMTIDLDQSADVDVVYRFESGQVANEITIEYGLTATSLGGPHQAKRRTLSAESGVLASEPFWFGLPTDDERVLPSTLCALSRQRYGLRPLVVELSGTWDDTTALLAAQHYVDRYAMPWRTCTIRAPSERYERTLAVGHVVRLIDSEMGLDVPARVVSRVVGGATIDLVLEWREVPL